MHNYFSFLFPQYDLVAVIVVSIYHENGEHLRDYSTMLGKDQSKIIEFKNLLKEVAGTSFQGSVTIPIIPDKEIDVFNKYNFAGSEFYMSYYSDNGGFSILHNGRSVRYLPSRPLRGVMRVLVDSSFDTAVVFQNAFYGSFLRVFADTKSRNCYPQSRGAV